jgi:hypothetical protein
MYFDTYFTKRLTDFRAVCIKYSARTSHRTQILSIRKSSQLMLCTEIMAVLLGILWNAKYLGMRYSVNIKSDEKLRL